MGICYTLWSRKTRNAFELWKGWGDFDLEEYASCDGRIARVDYLISCHCEKRHAVILDQAFQLLGDDLELFDDSSPVFECLSGEKIYKCGDLYDLCHDLPEEDVAVAWIRCKDCEEGVFTREHAPPYNCSGKIFGLVAAQDENGRTIIPSLKAYDEEKLLQKVETQYVNAT